MGFFGMVRNAVKEGGKKAKASSLTDTQRLEAREKKADSDLAYYSRKDKVRSKEREARALKTKPFREGVTNVKRNLGGIREGFKKRRGSGRALLRNQNTPAYSSSSSDRTREILSGSSGNPFYDEPKRKEKKGRSITIRL